MTEPKPANAIHRRIREMRDDTATALLSGAPTGVPADQVGLAYANLVSRYNVLRELDEFVGAKLQEGDDLDA